MKSSSKGGGGDGDKGQRPVPSEYVLDVVENGCKMVPFIDWLFYQFNGCFRVRVTYQFFDVQFP
ncbi:hypothetical protein A2U01_0045557, partial [Trifolium medium]|nr:hypothetical protein [Trifolium medium]